MARQPTSIQSRADYVLDSAVEKAAKGVMLVLSEAAGSHSLSNSRLSIVVVEELKTAAISGLDKLGDALDRVTDTARAKRASERSIRSWIEAYLARTDHLGRTPPSFENSGSREEVLNRERARLKDDLNAYAEQIILGWTRPPAQPWSARHPILWAIILVVLGAALNEAFESFADELTKSEPAPNVRGPSLPTKPL